MRPFIFPGYVEQLNFPEFKATIAAPVDHTPRKDYMACTEKYQSQVKLLPDHTVANYVCGQPFPNASIKEGDPDAGWKAVWNYEYRWQNFRLLVHAAGHLGPLLAARTIFLSGNCPRAIGWPSAGWTDPGPAGCPRRT